MERFVRAQEGVYDRALAEIVDGKKRSHWMWFIFPQLAGLGSSPTAQQYAIRDLAEAREFMAHPLLGPRLVSCSSALLAHPDKSANQIFGFPDDLKLRSSMTLFSRSADHPTVFHQVIDLFYEGPDERTLALLDRPG
ncbi:uncharacterized protein (DUF1810 family) [Actinoplanes lutulentus]|uniref:Uncharacterized protein (DUF1810 family) n=1 Tax=Actinoplanes lutulentus TaxID=1287878 RepID=A0A327ZGI2_9ACTN|nr:DUF1810 domain-containing protein [Actinoplanes lutulentus]MBB2949160.1 uncharacterized protein (DUF1810 family) [Actinoplanes lutulentus]RAK34644.1 uncharacterized protein (DUF1810 family) [Actinoplanes lutulentus]